VPLLIIDDLGMRKLPMTSAEDLLEIVMRRYERASTLPPTELLHGVEAKSSAFFACFFRCSNAPAA
jgi:hypothetical protein